MLFHEENMGAAPSGWHHYDERELATATTKSGTPSAWTTSGVVTSPITARAVWVVVMVMVVMMWPARTSCDSLATDWTCACPFEPLL